MANYPTTQISTNNFDSSADSPSNARSDLLQLVQNINAFVACIDTSNGLAKLDGSGRVSSSNLTIPSSALSGEIFNTSNISPSAIQGSHIENSTLEKVKFSTSAISAHTSLGTSNTILPTCGAVKTYLENNLSNVVQGVYDTSSLSVSGTNTVQSIGSLTRGNPSLFSTTTVNGKVRAKILTEGVYLTSFTATVPSGVSITQVFAGTNVVPAITYTSNSSARGQGYPQKFEANDTVYFKTTGTGTITNIQIRFTLLD